MKIFLTIFLLAGGFLFYRLKLTPRGEELQGRWTIVSAPEGWKIVPGMDVMVTSDEIHMRIGTIVTSKLQYTADYDAGTIDAGESGGKVRQGIYRLEGDTLTLNVAAEGKPRPFSPDATDGGSMRWVLRRGRPL